MTRLPSAAAAPALRFSGRLTRIEAIGFGSVIALVWLDEVLDLPHVLFGDPVSPTRFMEAAWESGVLLVLATVVLVVTRRLVAQVAYLESYVVLCAWCRRVRSDEEWLGFEAYLSAHRTDTSHGMCPDCEAKFDPE